MTVATPARDAWPEVVLDAAVLRGLDARALREIAGAGRLTTFAAGERVYRAGSDDASFFVLASGRVALRAVRRGDDEASDLRSVAPGDAFGEEATVGATRRADAVAVERSTVAEIPVHVFRRAAARSGKAEIAAKLERLLRRSATRDLLRTIALTRDLPDEDLERLLDAVRYERFDRGAAIYREGDPARELWLVGEGLVQIQVEDGDKLHVRAYVSKGDFFGDAEVQDGVARAATAIASGPSLLLAIPAPELARLSRAHPALLADLQRVAADQRSAQRAVVRKAAESFTQHLFRDVYRLQVARSLLVIDLDACVRCGHCAWACSELYGVARLVRRGDKVVTQHELAAPGAFVAARVEAPSAPTSLLLPNSCQHCENPACMVDCPTGAIGRDPGGEVFIREALCTGCGACAKACPWDNVQMAARPAGAPRPAGTAATADVAVKCDLCRSYEDGPACVQVCPTSAIQRIRPSADLEEVADLLGASRRRGGAATGSVPEWSIAAGAAVAALAIGVVGATMQSRGAWRPDRGLGYASGVGAAILFAALLAYAWPKRGVRLWKTKKPIATSEDRRREAERAHADEGAAPVRSKVRPHAVAHVALGVVSIGLVLAHAPWPPPRLASAGAALYAAFAASAFFGVAMAVLYKLVPPALTRLERTAALPEDLGRARRELVDLLYRELSGKSELVKAVASKILLPYAKRPLGWVALVASGRRLRDEERRLRERIEEKLEGRGAERLGGLSELVRIVVELRAMPGQRVLQLALRVGLPLHVVTFALATVLLVVHVVAATRYR